MLLLPLRVALVGALLCPPAAARSATIYVSPAGDDGNTGAAGSPLRSLGAARDKARTYPATTSVAVEFADGVYPTPVTEVFQPQDSGTARSPRTYAAAPGARAVLSAGVAVTGWRAVKQGDAAWPFLDADARAAVKVAPLPATDEVPRALFDQRAEAAGPSERAVRSLPNTNVVSSLVPVPRQDSEVCRYLGQFNSERGCRTAALAVDGVWAYAWHDPQLKLPEWARGCYGRIDAHGSRDFASQPGVMSGLLARSNTWREVTDWEISANVTTQHRCPGAECEYFDSAQNKSTMHVSLDHLDRSVGK